MNPFEEFAAALVGANKAESTRRLYLGAARMAVEISGKLQRIADNTARFWPYYAK